jgi:flagellar basal-body rod protein FlgG
MIKALWTAASGMTAQQFNVDVISNNLSNVNTTAYKRERVEFKDLLYETFDRAYMLDGIGQPVNLQVGHGSAAVATVKNFETGNFEKTDNPLDFAIEGEGFFMVLGPRDEVVFTRDGSFKISVTDEGRVLTTSDGYSVLDEYEEEIILDADLSRLVVSPDGELSVINEEGITEALDQRIGLVSFENRNGLESIGKNFYAMTDASGEPIPNEELDGRSKSTITQRFLEASNVQIVEEMVKLIIAQRAYEINSKAIQSSDEMLGIANNLRR